MIYPPQNENLPKIIYDLAFAKSNWCFQLYQLKMKFRSIHFDDLINSQRIFMFNKDVTLIKYYYLLYYMKVWHLYWFPRAAIKSHPRVGCWHFILKLPCSIQGASPALPDSHCEFISCLHLYLGALLVLSQYQQRDMGYWNVTDSRGYYSLSP